VEGESAQQVGSSYQNGYNHVRYSAIVHNGLFDFILNCLNYRDVVTKKGYLSYPENADDAWVKRWIVYKRYCLCTSKPI
jgi:hypothetical protein